MLAIRCLLLSSPAQVFLLQFSLQLPGVLQVSLFMIGLPPAQDRASLLADCDYHVTAAETAMQQHALLAGNTVFGSWCNLRELVQRVSKRRDWSRGCFESQEEA